MKKNNHKKTTMIILMIFGLSFAQQFQNNYCDLDCMNEAFELTDDIAGGANHSQAYEIFVSVYNHCTETYCNAIGRYNQ